MMNLRTCNTTLDTETVDNEIKAYGSLTFHQLGLIVAAATGLFATLLSLFLMHMHATHYSRPWEQRHIIRILFMIPIYSVVSFLSLYFYHHFVYYEVLRDCYDAFAIASFFSLLCNYVAPDLHGQKEYFRQTTPKNWLLPLSWFQKCCGSQRKGPWRVPRSGLTWFNIIWVFVFQYCFLRVLFTIVAVVSQHFGRYCVEGLSPAYAHVWTTVISAVSVSLTMYCLIQFYYQLKEDVAQHSPLLKVLSIKLVIFFIFWQTIILSFLNDSGVIQASDKIAQPDITIGIPAMLICIEMAVFSILHIFAYPWQPYDLNRSVPEAGATRPLDKSSYHGGFLGIKAYAEAFNPWDIIKAIGRGFKWAFVGRRSRQSDPSYKQHLHSTPLSDGVPVKGRYEPLADQNADESTPYDAFSGSFTRPGYANSGPSPQIGNNEHYERYEQQTMMAAGPTRQDASSTEMPVQPQHVGVAHGGFDQDTGYHAPAHAAQYQQTAYQAYRPDMQMPDEAHYAHAR